MLKTDNVRQGITMNKNVKYPIDYRNGHPDCLGVKKRIGSLLSRKAYNVAVDFGFYLYESDVQWIEKNITKNSTNNNRDIFWRFDSYTHSKNKSPYVMDYMAIFLNNSLMCKVSQLM